MLTCFTIRLLEWFRESPDLSIGRLQCMYYRCYGCTGGSADRPIGHLATGGSDGDLGHVFPLSASFSLSF